MVKLTSTAETVLRERYYIQGESEWEHLTARVSNHFGNTDEEKSSFKDLMDNMDWLPNSPVLMNAGTEIQAYSACYVLPVDDSIESIYKYITDSALISKSGGGVGANFSALRPKDSLVGSTDGVASGPLSFMSVQNESTEQIKQGGRRRGALMGILGVDHEDIWDFVAAKDEEGELSNFNLSVGITDEFMEKVQLDSVVNPYREEKDLWDEIIQRAWYSAEPGVLFMDTIEAGNTVPHLGTLKATNPCGEQPLLPYESCIAKGTLVTTPCGSRKIEDIPYSGHVIGTDYKAHTFAKVVNKGIQPVVQLHLANRSTLVVTPDHKIELVDGTFVEAQDTIGKDVKVLSGITPYTLYDAKSELHEMLGWLHGDGWYSSTIGISFNAKDGDFEVKERLAKCFIDTFAVTTKPSVDTDERYNHQSDKKLSLTIAENYGMVKGTHTNIEFPSHFYKWTDPQQRSFIRGLFSADAGIGGKANTQIAFATSSEVLGNQVVAYLNSIGIHTSKYTTVFNSNRNDQYRIQVTKQSANVFMDTIGFLTSVKTNKFERSRYMDEVSYKVVEIEAFGVEEVYDIVEVSNVNTFWANGVGVHNCTLGSINLSNHVSGLPVNHEIASSSQALSAVNWAKLKQTVHTATLFLNRILDASEMPIPECQEAMELTRKIGLGIMGLHDMLIQLGLPYDSEEGRNVAGQVMAFIAEEADVKSVGLAGVEGFYTGISNAGDTEGVIEVLGPVRRNANLTTIAPTGTLSMIADCSSGCEPYYAPVTYKTVLDGTTFAMPNKWVQKALEDFCDADDMAYSVMEDQAMWPQFIKDEYKGAEDIHWSDHLKMQGVLQQHVDSSISKTINCPNETTVEEVKEMYEEAWRLGCKGVTIYRDGSRETQVLSTSSGDDESSGLPDTSPEECEEQTTWPPTLYKLDLPDTAKATRYRVSVDGQKVYLMVTEGDEGEPLELFVKFAYESDPVWNVLCRQLSLSLRYGVPLVDIIKQLDKSVIGVGDMSAKISRVLKKYLPFDPHGYIDIPKGGLDWEKEPIKKASGNTCPECDAVLVAQGGCFSCPLCYWERCG